VAVVTGAEGVTHPCPRQCSGDSAQDRYREGDVPGHRVPGHLHRGVALTAPARGAPTETLMDTGQLLDTPLLIGAVVATFTGLG
jgi:hypothetical protein